MDKVIEYIMKHCSKRDGHKAKYKGEVDWDDDDYERDGRRNKRKDRSSHDDWDEDDWDDEESDGRRGVKGTGRSKRRDRADDDDIVEFKKELNYKLMNWVENLENKDGTDGPHFSKEKVCEVAEHMNLKMDEYDYTEKDLYIMANVRYSDDCKELKDVIPREKELQKYVGLAKSFLEDEDSNLTGHDKVLMYYCDIVKFKK